MRILLIEDDHILGAAVHDQILADGHVVDWVKRLDDAEAYRTSASYDLVLLDLMLPDGLGIPFLRRARAAGDTTPCIILTALDQITDRIDGLNAGADDYLVKPFHLAELSARISAVARRYAGNPNPYLEFGDLMVNISDKSLRRGGKDIKLTAREWALAEIFFLHPTQLYSKPQLEERLHNFDSDAQSNTIEVYISRLRKKLGAEKIQTVHGMGYRFAP